MSFDKRRLCRGKDETHVHWAENMISHMINPDSLGELMGRYAQTKGLPEGNCQQECPALAHFLD